MKKGFVIFLSFLTGVTTMAQKIAGKLRFQQGQVLQIEMEMKTAVVQQAMGQAIDFHVTGAATHQYKATNVTDDNNTLRHSMNRLSFQFDGMGQKLNFDSDNPKDMEGRMGKPMKEMLEKNYDVIIDPNGKVMMAQPEKITLAAADERLKLVADMMKDLTNVVFPPKKGEGSFFRVLPENEAAIGESWSETGKTETGEFTNNYTLKEINDSTVVVALDGNSTTSVKADMRGMETVTNMNHKTTGNIIVDKATGIVRQKTLNTESSGATQITAMGATMPLTSKSTIVINVKPQP
ncbi:MAG TPA: DUF6263 family protein [Chitinophagaceae bacterium]